MVSLYGYCTFNKLQIDLSALITPDALLDINVRGIRCAYGPARPTLIIPKRPLYVEVAKIEIEPARCEGLTVKVTR